ncbi:putative elongator complex protein 1 [Coemansia sp. RSA 1972]|nr:putative elongator complex protein 1 [Coemansia sp. RSA 1972]
MRNLSILGETAVELPPAHRLLDLCVDVTEERVFVLCGDDSATARLLTYDSQYTLTDECVLPFSAAEQIMSMHFVMEREHVVIALASGDICTVGSGVEVVGTVDAGIAACRWSPDDEILALVTGEARVLLMTADFDVLCEHALDEGQEESVMVNVGWGTRETQYQGRGMQQEEEQSSQQEQSPEIQVSWRGDGQFLAVSFVRADMREIRVFSRDGQLHSVCEKVTGLEHTLAWKPSGRLIAATEKRAHRHEVVFFERNGLRHGEFVLHADTQRALALSWNSDSSMLAVVADVGSGVCVQLWADRNYHWYMKQELRGLDIQRVVWDPEDPMHVLVVCASGFTSMRLHSVPAVAHVASAESNAASCVVNGAQVLYTPFAHANVPPPMCLHTLDARVPVRHVSFAAFGAGNGFALLLADRRTVVLYACDSGKSCPREIQRFVLHSADVRQIAWLESDVVVSLGAGKVGIARIGDGDEVVTHFCPEHDSPLVLLSAAPHVGRVLVEDTRGRVFNVSPETERLELLAELPTQCVDIDAVDCGDLGMVVVGRTARNQLYANTRLLSPACSSFYLRKDVLVFTTTTHYVRFVAVNEGLLAGDIPADDEAVVSEARRRVERGSTIVLASPTGDAVVFQMPRGNLETVRPRALVLAAVRQALDARQYREALMACRVNRIDMNMLYDYAPAAFMGDLAEFVAQVNEADLLNLFVSSLRDEDVTQTMYTGIQSQLAGEDKPDGANPGKTTAVCRALRPVLQSAADASRFMPTVLTTLMCEKPPAIDAALQIIAALGQDRRDAALTYLLFLSDVNTVYDAALGLYDLPLALLVAQRSQRDPREYLPALGELNALPSEEYRRFRIDAQLNRHESALGHLCAALWEDSDRWTEVAGFIQQHRLFRQGAELLAAHACIGDVYVMYGDALAADKDWGQAAAAYLLSQKAVSQAVDAFVQNKEWRSAMSLASAANSGFGPQAVYDTARQASSVLEDHHLFGDAAAVLFEYTEETEDAVMLLVRGSHWAEAVRCSHARERSDLIETTVRPGMDAACESLEEDIGEIGEGFAAKVERLRAVRLTPLSQMTELAGVDDSVDVMPDTASMASQFTTFTATLTDISKMTGSTGRRLSKNKRKAERKRVRGKKGSVFEESYLVDSLSKLIARVRVHQDAVRNLNLALLQFGRAAAAARLQRVFAAVVEAVLRDGDWVFDRQRVLVQGDAGQIDLVDDVNAEGLPATPRLAKPVLPSLDAWRISALP